VAGGLSRFVAARPLGVRPARRRCGRDILCCRSGPAERRTQRGDEGGAVPDRRPRPISSA
jgi:hypothetical protein